MTLGEFNTARKIVSNIDQINIVVGMLEPATPEEVSTQDVNALNDAVSKLLSNAEGYGSVQEAINETNQAYYTELRSQLNATLSALTAELATI